MKFPFGENDQEQPKADADLTLGIGSLLSIFFGVVLICGIFFGFGYSMGRRNVHPAPTPVATPKPTASSSALQDDQAATSPKTQPPGSGSAFPPGFTPPVPDGSRSDEGAGQPAPSSAAGQDGTSARKPTRSPRVADQDAQDPSLTAVAPTHRTAPPNKPHAGVMATPADASNTPAGPGHPIMVQIAAVSRQEDAEVLAGALRKRGFNPQIRSGLADKFFHIQVGPFNDTSQAETMKQHLLADGYNAIVK